MPGALTERPATNWAETIQNHQLGGIVSAGCQDVRPFRPAPDLQLIAAGGHRPGIAPGAEPASLFLPTAARNVDLAPQPGYVGPTRNLLSVQKLRQVMKAVIAQR